MPSFLLQELLLHLPPSALDLVLQLEQQHILRLCLPPKLLELAAQLAHLIPALLSLDLYCSAQRGLRLSPPPLGLC